MTVLFSFFFVFFKQRTAYSFAVFNYLWCMPCSEYNIDLVFLQIRKTMEKERTMINDRVLYLLYNCHFQDYMLNKSIRFHSNPVVTIPKNDSSQWQSIFHVFNRINTPTRWTKIAFETELLIWRTSNLLMLRNNKGISVKTLKSIGRVNRPINNRASSKVRGFQNLFIFFVNFTPTGWFKIPTCWKPFSSKRICYCIRSSNFCCQWSICIFFIDWQRYSSEVFSMSLCGIKVW